MVYKCLKAYNWFSLKSTLPPKKATDFHLWPCHNMQLEYFKVEDLLYSHIMNHTLVKFLHASWFLKRREWAELYTLVLFEFLTWWTQCPKVRNTYFTEVWPISCCQDNSFTYPRWKDSIWMNWRLPSQYYLI